MKWLDILNEQQREAVTHGDGPLLVVAGAGSGKTRVLTYRIAYLLETKKAHPSQILAVTFTNKAAAEVKDRLYDLIGPAAESLWVGTFHATCVQILRRHGDRIGLERNFVILDTSDQLGVVRAVLKDLNVDSKSFEPRAVLSSISAAKNELVDYPDYQERATDFWERNVGRFYEHYQKRLTEHSAVDFDDLLRLTVRLFEKDPEVLQQYQDRFRYVLIDEYQDTNRAQYVLINLICAASGNLCVVGDADQSIYRFRGADIRNILDFSRDYPRARVVLLEQNYRSTKHILDGANALIANNLDRPEKKLYTENPEGERIKLFRGQDEKVEAAFIAREIETLRRDKGFEYSDCTILYRTHAQSRIFEEEFVRRGLPYHIVSGLRFYERREIKDLIAYLRVIANPADGLSLLRIINVPKRGIGNTTVGRIEQFADETGLPLWEAMKRIDEGGQVRAAYAKRVEDFAALIEGLRGLAPSLSLAALVQRILDETGMIEELQKERSLEAEGRIENLKEFISVAKGFEQEVDEGLDAFLDHVALISDVDGYEDTGSQLTMMTLHAAKGLEFPVVFLVGLEDGVFPHSRALWEPGELEEERRLCYVGMTRARQVLYLTSAMQRTLYGQTTFNQLSRFVDEIPDELIEEVHAESLSGLGGAGFGRAGSGAIGLGGARQGGAGQGGARSADSPFASRSPGASAGARGGAGSGAQRGRVGRNAGSDAAIETFREGEKVRHTVFGLGTVVSVTEAGGDAILTIAFDGLGVKRLMAGMAPLERV